jgi:four helix bundle protein
VPPTLQDLRPLGEFEIADSASLRAADGLVPEVYRATAGLPQEERYGLHVQIRRSSVSVPCNIAEGSSRRSTNDYCRFLEIAAGSARECGYLIGLAGRLEFLPTRAAATLADQYEAIHAGLVSAISGLEQSEKGDP